MKHIRSFPPVPQSFMAEQTFHRMDLERESCGQNLGKFPRTDRLKGEEERERENEISDIKNHLRKRLGQRERKRERER